MKASLFILLQHLLPQHILSRIVGWLAHTEHTWTKNHFIQWFIQRYQVDMSIAAEPDAQQYKNFNDFFTRALAKDQRPIADNGICCPADGCISQLGNIKHGRIFQAKGQEYTLLELVGGDEAMAQPFDAGHFATVYLSPKDYHRVHMPVAGTLTSMVHIPGDLFSVNDTTAQHVPRLFARNERVVAFFDTDIGPMAIVLVGAMIVASIETTWAGLVTPIKKQVRHTSYTQAAPIFLEKGTEMGRFKLGSTAIILFAKDAVNWKQTLAAQSSVLMGEKIADC